MYGYIPPKLIVGVCIFVLLVVGIFMMINSYNQANPPAITDSWEQTYQVKSIDDLPWLPFVFISQKIKLIHTNEGKTQPVIYDSIKTEIDPQIDCFPIITIHHVKVEGDENVKNLSAIIKFHSCEQAATFFN
jgi:hypothetical protein